MISNIGGKADAHGTCISDYAQLVPHRLPYVGGFSGANVQTTREAAQGFAVHQSLEGLEFEGR